MTVTQPWWGAPLFTLAGVLLAQGGTLLNEHLRRRAERTNQRTRETMTMFLEYQQEVGVLLRLRVWPVKPSGATTPTEPSVSALERRFNDLKLLMPAPAVLLAAFELLERCLLLAATIDEVRDAHPRGPGGSMPDAESRRCIAARGAAAEALEHFTVAWRQDLGRAKLPELGKAPLTLADDPATTPPADRPPA